MLKLSCFLSVKFNCIWTNPHKLVKKKKYQQFCNTLAQMSISVGSLNRIGRNPTVTSTHFPFHPPGCSDACPSSSSPILQILRCHWDCVAQTESLMASFLRQTASTEQGVSETLLSQAAQCGKQAIPHFQKVQNTNEAYT